ncbi:carboxypeptidase regulatory-like domain-containing protein [Pseudoduganella sp. UC29_106]|uniref:carboxypeptidase regulatory-like domain-containing protein n=1 Tax=Pseudoduganella sp. UC29_106 TaxID=3374553 RepID=UPI0037580C2B
MAEQQADGGYGLIDGASQAYVTALAMLALEGGNQTPAVLNTLQRASSWLLSRQQADAGWGSAIDTSLAHLALLGAGNDSSQQAAIRANLLAQQGADGAWSGDPYVTALALRAVAAQPKPVPTTGAVTLQAIDAQAGAGIAGAIAQFVGSSIAPAVADARGRIVFNDVPAGPYTVAVSAPGYGGLSMPFTLRAGTTSDLGVFSMTVAPTTGVLKGVVKDGSGNPVSDATVAISGAAAATAATGVDGSYAFSGLTPGALAIVVSKPGFATISAGGTLAAGMTMVFSPTLPPAGQGGDSKGSMIGQVVDSVSGSPLAGVAVVTAIGASAVTGADGRFLLAGLAPDAYAVRFAAAGYAERNYSAVLVAAGSATDFQQVPLAKALTSISLVGTVSDKVSGKPVAQATVAVSGAQAVVPMRRAATAWTPWQPATPPSASAHRATARKPSAPHSVQPANTGWTRRCNSIAAPIHRSRCWRPTSQATALSSRSPCKWK